VDKGAAKLILLQVIITVSFDLIMSISCDAILTWQLLRGHLITIIASSKFQYHPALLCGSGERNGGQRKTKVRFGRTMMQALELLQLVKRHISRQSDVEQ